MSEYRLCMGCMSQMPDEAAYCPHCGFREEDLRQPAHYLPPHTVLHGKYILGRGLGHGGFGITYLAYDTVLGLKLAVKEYLPQDCSTRQPGTRFVMPYSGEYVQRFEYGKGQFLGEARTLARFDGHPHIVDVRDFFEENGTAYLVMRFLEGVTLREYLQYRRSPLPFSQVMQIMQPVMGALRDVHRAGVLHRDISPDNIFLSTNGIKLIDFGAARQALSAARSVSIILKPGYAPQEQYSSHSNQGPWTDIYALAACMYRALTGKVPQESLDRAQRDELLPPSRLGSDIPYPAEQVLLRAMAVDARERYQSIDILQQAFQQAGVPSIFPSFRLQTAQVKQIKDELQARSEQAAQNPAVYGSGKGRVQVDDEEEESETITETEEEEEEEENRHTVLRTVLICLLLFFLLAAGVLWAVARIFDGGRSERPVLPDATEWLQPTETPRPEEQPEATEVVQATETPVVTATPKPTKVPDPSFVEGAESKLQPKDYLPPVGSRITVYENGSIRTYLTDRSANGKYVLMAPFRFTTGQINGDLSAYWVNIEGKLLQTDYRTQESVVLLPRSCRVGEDFAGGTIVAVNYTRAFGTDVYKNLLVVKSGSDYLFYAPGVGLYAIQHGSMTGNSDTLIYQVTKIEDADTGLLLRTYEEQFGTAGDEENEVQILEE